jgi:hypothetical protein
VALEPDDLGGLCRVRGRLEVRLEGEPGVFEAIDADSD